MTALHSNRTAVEALLKRTIAIGGRVLTPAFATGEVLMVGLAIVLGLSLGLAANRAHAVEPPSAFVAGTVLFPSPVVVAPSCAMEQTKVEKPAPSVAAKP